MTTATANKIDILHGPLLKSILLFALPLASSSILQQLFNAVDLAVVGRFASSIDQAAVGCNGALINLMINFFVGISVGANVVIATCLGSGKTDNVSKAVHTALTLGLGAGIIILLFNLLFAHNILAMMDTPEDTLPLAITYFKIFSWGIPFILLYNFGAAVLRSVGDTKRPLYALVIAGVTNAILNMILVIVFHLGVAGVAIATVVSNVISSSIVIYLLTKEQSVIGLTLSKLGIDGEELKKMLRVGVPAGIQSAVFSISNIFIQIAINSFGSAAVAASAVVLIYEFITYFILSTFNQTAVTFTSQNYGAKNFKRCKKIYETCMYCGASITGCLSMFIVLNDNFFIGLFTADPEVVEYAVVRMKYLLLLNFVAASYEISGGALRGMGYSLPPAIITILGTCALRLCWIYTIFRMNPTFDMLLLVYPISWLVTGVIMLVTYFKTRKHLMKTVYSFS